MNEPRSGELLAVASRRVHRVLLEGLLEQGTLPDTGTLAAKAEVGPADLPARLRELAAADYLALDDDRRVTCLYPLSPIPTSHAVAIDGQRRYAMCAIDLLGIPAMLGRELALAGRCAACEAPIALRVRPGELTMADPATTLVVARRDEAEPAVTACCPFTVFACGPTHAEQVAEQTPGTRVLPLDHALVHAEALFGDLLAPTLPATRPRGKDWSRRRGA